MSIADTNENSGYIFTLSLHLSLCYSQRLQTDTLKQNGHINISSTLNAHTFQEKNILKFKVKTTLWWCKPIRLTLLGNWSDF